MKTHLIRSFVVCVLALAGLAPLHATTYSYTITDSTTDLWTEGTNWDATPASDTDTELVFGPAGAFDPANLTNVNTNDLGPFQLNSLTLQGTGAEGFYAFTTIAGGTLEFVHSSTNVGPQINITVSNDVGSVFYSVNSDLLLTNTLTITGNSDAGITFGGAIGGPGDLVKSGDSTVFLTGANSYGATVIDGGALVIDNNGTDTFGTLGNGDTTLHGGTLADGYGGGLEFRNSATAGSGTITANGGSVAGAFGSSVIFGGISTAGAATLIANGGTDGGYAGNIGFYEDSLGGMAAIELHDSGSYLDISFHNGGLAIGSLSGSGSAYLGGNTLTVGSNDSDTTFSGALQDGGPGGPAIGSFTKTGTGTLTLSGENTYSGDTAIEAGTLELTGTLGGGDYLGAIADDGVLSVSSASDQILEGVISGSGSLVKDSGGKLTLSADNTYTGGTTISGGTLQLGNNTVTGGVIGDITDNGALVFAHSSDLEFADVISGTGRVEQAGTGILTLSSVQTYTGATTVSGGTLALSGDDRLSASTTISITGGAKLDLGGHSQTVAGLGGAASGLAGTITAGTITTTGDVYLASGTFANTLAGEGVLYIGGSTSTVNLTGANDATTPDHEQVIIGGGTTGEANLVTLGNANALAAASENVHLWSGALNLNGQANVRANSIVVEDGDASGIVNIATGTTASFAGGVTLVTGMAQIGGSGRIDLSGVLSGAGGFTKTSSGTVTLSNDNTYTGNTEILDGALVISGTLGSGDYHGAIANSGSLTFSAPNADQALAGIISGTGSLTKSGTGTLILSAANTYSGNTTLSAGSLEVIGSLGAGTYNGAIANAGTLAISSSADQILGGVISGTGTLTKSGTGTLKLGVTNTYLGGTVLSGGTLGLGADDALGSGLLTINGGNIRAADAVRTLTNNITANGSFSLGRLTNLAGTIALTNDITITSANPDSSGPSSSTLSGIISGAHRLTFDEGANPTGTIVLAGENTYTGGTAITSGNVQIGTGGTTGSILGDVVDNGSLTFNRSDAITYAGVISGTGSVAQIGTGTPTSTGTLTLTGTNTYEGGTTVTGWGNLEFSSGANLSTGNITLDGGGLKWAPGNTTDISSRLNPLSADGGIFDTNGNNVSFASALVGDPSYYQVVKTGAGTLTLSGASAGAFFFVAGGTLDFGTGAYQGDFVMGGNFGLASDQYGPTAMILSGAGTSLTSSGQSDVGYHSDFSSSLTIADGASFSGASQMVVGDTSTAETTVTVTGANSTYSIGNNNLFIGANSSDRTSFIVSDGASATAHDTWIGYRTTGESLLTVSGTGSTFTATGNLYIGLAPGPGQLLTDTSSMIVSGGASASAATTTIGRSGALGANSLTLTGTGSKFTTGTLTVADGVSDNGTLNIGSAADDAATAGGILDAATVTGGPGAAVLQFNTTGTKLAPTYFTRDGTSSGTGVNTFGGLSIVNTAGTTILSGTGTHTGPTIINGGTLVVNGTNASSAVTINATGILGGHGTVGSVTINSGGTISPGNSPGTLTTGNETWNGGGSYVWELNDATGTAGTNWDLLSIGGSLDIAASGLDAANTFTIYLTSLNGSNVGGHPALNFDSLLDQSWVIATTTGAITGYSDGKFAIDTSAFFNPTGPNSSWHLSVVPNGGGNNLVLSYTAVPEPSACAVGIVGLLGGIILLRRRRITSL